MKTAAASQLPETVEIQQFCSEKTALDGLTNRESFAMDRPSVRFSLTEPRQKPQSKLQLECSFFVKIVKKYSLT